MAAGLLPDLRNVAVARTGRIVAEVQAAWTSLGSVFLASVDLMLSRIAKWPQAASPLPTSLPICP